MTKKKRGNGDAGQVASQLLRILREKGLSKGFPCVMDEVMKCMPPAEGEELLGEVKRWVELQVSPQPPKAEPVVKKIKVPTKPRKQTVPATPPWLGYAGLPSDGSVGTAAEVLAFSNFVGATHSEQEARSTIRGSLQKMIQHHVSPEVTIKVIGSWSYGLATFTSPFDLAVEAPDCTTADTMLDSISAMFQEMGVEAAFHQFTGFRALRLCSSSLSSGDGFAITMVSNGADGPPNARLASAKVSSRLNTELVEFKQTAVIVRSVIQKTNVGANEGGINGYLVTLLFMAFVERHRDHPEAGDSGWVLKNFFKFYASFDFGATSIVPVPPTSEEAYTPRPPDSTQMHILDPCSSSPTNVAEKVTKLAQLVGTIQYVDMLIERYDKSTKSVPFLPNLVACGKPFSRRHSWLKNSSEVTKDLAVSVAQCVADLFLDSVPNGPGEAPIQIATCEGCTDGVILRQQLISRIVGRTGSPLAQFKGRVPQLAEAVSRYKDEPEVREQLSRSLQSSVTMSHAVLIVKETADYVADPKNSAFKNELRKLAFKGKAEEVGNLLFKEVATCPSSALQGFKHCLPLLADALRTQMFAEDPGIEYHRHRIMQEFVTPEVVGRVAEEAADVLEELAEGEVKELVVAANWAPGKNFSASDGFVAMMLAKGSTTMARLQPALVASFVQIISSAYSCNPLVLRSKQRAACTVLTRPVTTVLHHYALQYLRRCSLSQLESLAAVCCDIRNGMSCTDPTTFHVLGLLRPLAADSSLLANQEVAARVFANLRA